MEGTAVAFAPGHISGYFKRIDGDSPKTTGSCGAGIVIDRGVTASVTPSPKTSVIVTDRTPDGESLISYGSGLIEELLSGLGVCAKVETTSGLPIGAGFGMSAAAILATLTATNAVFELGMSAEAISELAHETEVAHNTGLGDVAAASGGGVAVRNAPGIFGVNSRFFPSAEICSVTFGSIFTPDVIGSPEKMAQVTAAFPVGEPATFTEFMMKSRQFAEASGLIPARIRPVLDACDEAGILASMTMLGCGVFAAADGFEILSGFGTAVPLKVCPHGPILLEV
ncbi:GHMP kinase [Methanorbis rubei]|uniref:Pantoate kinase n=1 Tax=Methanorbis rubei TaxID=3028300 RepID=A0AAE4MHL8_9EURY|nr:hypothetical protein [Methanocorpusculaceae archaeon Cs1]